MKDMSRVRMGGLLGICGGLLWFIAVLVQHALALQTPGTPGYAPMQVLYALAFLGILGSILALRWSGAAGSGWFAAIATGIYVVGISGFAVAAATSAVTGNEDIPIAPFAALITNLGALLVSIAVLRARRWGSWQRFAPLLVFLYSFFGFTLPAIITDHEPSLLALFVLGIPWLIQGLAVYTQAQVVRAPVPA